jgi:hypothetical protein
MRWTRVDLLSSYTKEERSDSQGKYAFSYIVQNSYLAQCLFTVYTRWVNFIIAIIISLLRRSMAPRSCSSLVRLPRWSVIRWVTKNLLSLAHPCFRWHVKPLVPAAFAVVSTWEGPFSLRVIHKEGLCPSSGDINRLMMMMLIINICVHAQNCFYLSGYSLCVYMYL